MNYPKAYQPEQGYKYQLLMRTAGEKAFEHLDYAKDSEDKKYLLNEYRLAYQGMRIELKSILLPKKYWKLLN